jgi:hypothetical protein
MNQVTIDDFRNVLILARRAVALQGGTMPAEEGEAAFKSIKMVEIFTTNLIEQQKQEQARIDAAVADAEKSLDKVNQKVNFVELNDEPTA